MRQFSVAITKGEPMTDSAEVPLIALDEFARRFQMRGRTLMWFLGAGASAAAGIPTASDMIWEFKQTLYVLKRKVSRTSIADLSNPTIRARIQEFIDADGHLPAAGTPEEYAKLFELVYSAESDRRTYIDAKIRAGKPSYGHLALATLMKAGMLDLVWTTNFDTLVSDGCAKVFENTSSLSTVAIDAPQVAQNLIADRRWPIEIKLHGDFRSRALKNTVGELLHQDEQLRQILVDACSRYGLVVAGYSGRDDSVMDALEAALEKSSSFPAGLFWLHRGGSPPLPRVQRLLRRANELKREASLVEIENFDETLTDLIRLQQGLDTESLDAYCKDRARRSAAPRPAGRPGWPVVRMNALEVTPPTVCRRIACAIGGHKEVREALEAAGLNPLAIRRSAGVLAFGRDHDLRRVFEPFTITEFDLHPIETYRLRHDSSERGLLLAALASALVRHRGLRARYTKGTYRLVPNAPASPDWKDLRNLVGPISGTVSGYHGLRWSEGIAARLEWCNDRLWLVFEPRTLFDKVPDELFMSTPGLGEVMADFVRERQVKRYNSTLNELIDFWSKKLAGDQLSALGAGEVDAVFTLKATTAFSRRAKV